MNRRPEPIATGRAGAVLLALSLASALGPGATPAPAQHAPPASAPAPHLALSDTSRIRRWREDLAYIRSQVRTRHPRPFHHCPEAVFDSAARAIEASLPTTEDPALAVECMRMVALLQDGHTMAVGTFPPLGFTSVLPVALRPFEDGIFVVAADAANGDAVGSRVTRIGRVAAQEAVDRVGTITSGDNRYTKLDRVPLFLMMPAVLHALGISEFRDRVVLETETEKGRRKVMTLHGGAPPAGFPGAFLQTEPEFPADWKTARRLPPQGPPRCDRRPEDAWWFEWLPEPRVLYLRLRRVDVVSSRGPAAEHHLKFFERLFALADSARPAALVVDLRHNHGGSNNVVDPLVRGIVERPWLSRKGGVFALTDRGTFSAAMNAAVFLKNQTRATFVGEPTGGGLNHYGDATDGQTPNFGMLLQVSTVPWLSRFPQDPRPWIAPEVAVPWNYSDWREGRDAPFEEVLDAVRHGTLERQMLEASRRGGPDAAVAAFREWTGAHPNPWLADPSRAVAGSLLELRDRFAWEDAAALGEALVRLEPENALYWRIAGEAFLHAGRRARAVESFRQALRIEPQSREAREILRELGESP